MLNTQKKLTFLIGLASFMGCAPGELTFTLHRFDRGTPFELGASEPPSPGFRTSSGSIQNLDFVGLHSSMDAKQHPSTGVWYIAYRDHDNGSKLTVKSLRNGTWQVVGSEGFTPTAATKIALSFMGSRGTEVPVVGIVATPAPIGVARTFGEVWRFPSQGTQGTWSQLGGELPHTLSVRSLQIAAINPQSGSAMSAQLIAVLSNSFGTGHLMIWSPSDGRWHLQLLGNVGAMEPFSSMRHVHLTTNGEHFFLAFTAEYPTPSIQVRKLHQAQNGFGYVFLNYGPPSVQSPSPLIALHPKLYFHEDQLYLSYSARETVGYQNHFRPVVQRWIQASDWGTNLVASLGESLKSTQLVSMGDGLVLFGISGSGNAPETLRAFSVTHSPGAPQTGLELDLETVSEHVIAHDLLHPRRQPVYFQVTHSAEANLIRSQVHRIP